MIHRKHNSKNRLRLGSWLVICDRCGFRFYGEELIKEWTGFMVCGTCHEPRNEQDFLRAVPDMRPKPYYRPGPSEQTDVVIEFGNESPIVFGDGSEVPSA